MTYCEFLQYLNSFSEESFAEFQRKLVPTKQHILGVRTPILRKIAKQYAGMLEEIFAYPDDVYEVTFIKLAMVSALPYEKFVSYLDTCVSKIDNWASCDSFKAACIRKHRQEFLTRLDGLFLTGKEFYQRYVFVMLLSYYVDKEYAFVLERYLQSANTQYYYVHMAAAWLLAEIIIKEYDFGVTLLKKGFLDVKTHNKAIQKSRESFRLTKEQKDYLSSLKK